VVWGLFQLACGSTVNRWDTSVAVLTWAGNLLAFAVTLQVCASSSRRRRFLRSLVYFAYALSVLSVLQYFSSEDKILWFYKTDGRALGPFVSRDRYAAFV